MQSSRDPVRTLLLGVVGGAVALASVACTALGSGGMEPGEQVDAVAARITAPAAAGDRSSLLLPEGTLELVVTEAGEAVPARDTLGNQDLSAASGARLVGIQWKVVPGAVSTVQTALAGPGKAPGALAVVAGDQQFSLTEGDQWRRRGAVFVAVPEDAELMVEVDYDMVTQRVDPRTDRHEVSAAAQALYDADGGRPPDRSCGDPEARGPGWVVSSRCVASVTEVSYVDGLGWAPEHEPWRVVRLDLSLTQAERNGARYTADDSSGAALLDGSDPALVVPRETDDDDRDSEYLVFPGSAGPHQLSVTRIWSLVRKSGPPSAPGRAELTLSHTMVVD